MSGFVAASHAVPTLVRSVQFVGALLFVLSLALGGKAYVQRFDASAAPGTSPWLPVAVDVGLFSAFALHHSVLARTRAKAWVHARLGSDVERACYNILASVLFLACTQLWMPVPGTWYALTGPWWWVGTAVQTAGVVITVVAARTLSVAELMGLTPPRQRTPTDGPPPLESRGLYGVVRHPIYFGWVLFVGGAPVMTSTRLLFAAISVAYLMIAIPFEERGLVEHFGDAYRDYRRRVRWRMVPGIY